SATRSPSARRFAVTTAALIGVVILRVMRMLIDMQRTMARMMPIMTIMATCLARSAITFSWSSILLLVTSASSLAADSKAWISFLYSFIASLPAAGVVILPLATRA